MYIDTHCHINKKYYDNIDSLINSIKANDVMMVINNSTSKDDLDEVLSLANKYDIIYSAIGYHPTCCDDLTDSDYKKIEEDINLDKVVAIGEIGLDYHYDEVNKEIQKEVFKKQLKIAEEIGIPVIVHSRDAIEDTYNILSGYNIKGCIHAFSGSVEMAKKFIKLGFYIGIGGVATFKNAKNIIDVIKEVPIEYILLETDSPYLTPEPYRGMKNSPEYIPLIAKKISEIKNISPFEVENITTSNAKRLFDLK